MRHRLVSWNSKTKEKDMPKSRDRRPRLSTFQALCDTPLFSRGGWLGPSVACVLADRRGRLSLLCGIPLDRKNYPNRLLLCIPSLGGGWEGFLSEGICPYFVALSLIKGTLFSCREGRSFDARRASLRCEETPSLSADGTVRSPLHSERGRGRGSREGGGEAPYNLLSTHLRALTKASIHGVISS